MAGLIALIFSGSRIAWFAVAVASVAVLWVHRREILPKLSKRAVAVAVLAGLLICLIAIVPVTDRVQHLFVDWQSLSTKGDYSTSLGVRAALWEIGVGLFKEAPILGHGQAMTWDLISRRLPGRFQDNNGVHPFPQRLPDGGG